MVLGVHACMFVPGFAHMFINVCACVYTRVCMLVCTRARVCVHVCVRVCFCAPGPDLSALLFSYTCLAYFAAELGGSGLGGGRVVGEGLFMPVVHPGYTFLWFCL